MSISIEEIKEIMEKYVSGEKTLEEVNAALSENDAGFILNPHKNEITEEEYNETVIGIKPSNTTGWGLLDTGTGTKEKVYVDHGVLPEKFNTLTDGVLDSYVLFIIADKIYQVCEDKIVEKGSVKCVGDDAPVIQKDVNMKRNKEFANTVQRQRTKRGVFDVSYDEDGYVVSAHHVTFN